MNTTKLIGVARVLNEQMHDRHLGTCSWRFQGTRRHLQRPAGISPVVTIPQVGREDLDVVQDMVDGILAANYRPDDLTLRRELLFALMEADEL